MQIREWSWGSYSDGNTLIWADRVINKLSSWKNNTLPASGKRFIGWLCIKRENFRRDTYHVADPMTHRAIRLMTSWHSRFSSCKHQFCFPYLLQIQNYLSNEAFSANAPCLNSVWTLFISRILKGLLFNLLGSKTAVSTRRKEIVLNWIGNACKVWLKEK